MPLLRRLRPSKFAYVAPVIVIDGHDGNYQPWNPLVINDHHPKKKYGGAKNRRDEIEIVEYLLRLKAEEQPELPRKFNKRAVRKVLTAKAQELYDIRPNQGLIDAIGIKLAVLKIERALEQVAPLLSKTLPDYSELVAKTQAINELRLQAIREAEIEMARILHEQYLLKEKNKKIIKILLMSVAMEDDEYEQ